MPATPPVPSARAQGESWTATLNYAFATQIGSGIYRVSGRTVQIYRISGSIRLVHTDDRGWGLRLGIPLTFGFYDFRLEDVLETGLPERLGTLALVPALEFEVPVREGWWLFPSLGFGGGKDFSGGEFSYIYAVALRSLVDFPWVGNTVRLGNRLVYTGYTTRNLDFVDDFGFFETGVDLRRPLGVALGSHGIDGSVFGVNTIYFTSPRIIEGVPERVEVRTGWEIGMTIGTVDPWKVLGIRMPRLGLSYRFGSGMDAWRFIIGNPFPLDSPEDEGPSVN